MSNQNAATHYGTSQNLIVAGERLEDFLKLTDTLITHFQPSNPEEQHLVEDLAHGRWMLWRRQRAQRVIEADVHASQPDPAKWTQTEFKRIALSDRYLTQATRAYNRALKNVESFAKERAKSVRWQAMHDLALQRLQLQQSKHEFALSNAIAKEQDALFRSAKCADSSPFATSGPSASPTPYTQFPPFLTAEERRKMNQAA
jgi:methionyl-tRNA formyltransferase